VLDTFQIAAQEPGTAMFKPPEGWGLVPQSESLPSRVKVMVVGNTEGPFPPSINLSTEDFNGSLNDYLQVVKAINRSRKSEWKNLGKIQTQAGEGNLSQTDTVTEWGPVRMLHVILLKNNVVYILTAAALKTDFAKYYKIFFDSLRSFSINQDPPEMAQRTPPPSEMPAQEQLLSEMPTQELLSTSQSISKPEK